MGDSRVGRPQGSRNIDWASVITQARRTPGLWVLPVELSAVTERTVMAIRRRERRALRMPDGVLRCRVKAGVTVSGVTLVTLLVKFEKKETPSGAET